jgi:hypothetical protein
MYFNIFFLPKLILVYKIVYTVLPGLIKLYKELVNLPKNTILNKIIDNLK